MNIFECLSLSKAFGCSSLYNTNHVDLRSNENIPNTWSSYINPLDTAVTFFQKFKSYFMTLSNL